MTGYSILHLVIAGICGFLALVHAAFFALVPRDRVQRAVALSFAGFTMVNLGIAGSGERAMGSLGDPRVWLVLGVIAVLPLWSGLLLTAWNMVGARLTPNRKALLLAAIAMALLRLAEIAGFLHREFGAGHAITWEQVMDSLETITTLPAWGMTLLVGTTCVVEAFRDLGRRSIGAWVLALTALPATALCVREVALTVGLVHGPTWLGLTGLPFLFTASGIVAMRYVQGMRETRGADEVSGYRLLRKLDAGGMGELYLAARVGPGGFERHVALKKMLIPAENEREYLVERFLAEARMAAGLVHTNIVAVHDVGRIEEGWFIAMEYLAGVTLAQIRDRARAEEMEIPAAFVATIGESVARGLAHAHAQQIVHRDISPQNIMMTFDGQVKIIDFGIAVEVGKRRTTEAGMVVGKGAYMSPERVSGMPGEPPADVFALGIVLYELLCGQRPFAGASRVELARAIQRGIFVPIGDLRADVPAAIADLVTAALVIDPAKRIRAEELATGLEKARSRLPSTAASRWMRDLCRDEWRAQRLAAVYAGIDAPATARVRLAV